MPNYWRYGLYPLAAFWLLWLYDLSNVFTMGYVSPMPKKVAIAIVGLVLPATFAMTRTRDGWVAAPLLAFLV